MVILKQPAVKEANNNFEDYHKYRIAALTLRHKLALTKFVGPKVV